MEIVDDSTSSANVNVAAAIDRAGLVHAEVVYVKYD